jgi:hypothetical protein
MNRTLGSGRMAILGIIGAGSKRFPAKWIPVRRRKRVYSRIQTMSDLT